MKRDLFPFIKKLLKGTLPNGLSIPEDPADVPPQGRDGKPLQVPGDVPLQDGDVSVRAPGARPKQAPKKRKIVKADVAEPPAVLPSSPCREAPEKNRNVYMQDDDEVETSKNPFGMQDIDVNFQPLALT